MAIQKMQRRLSPCTLSITQGFLLMTAGMKLCEVSEIEETRPSSLRPCTDINE